MTHESTLKTLAVIGAGTMGSGIAQKYATEGFSVVLVDIDDGKAQRGLDSIRETLDEGIARRIFEPLQAEQILSRITASSDWGELSDVDLAVEAVFEDQGVKQQVFRKLESVCRPDTILATNTSSFSVTDLATCIESPERVVGLHYFFHPAKNRLVEVVAGAKTSPRVLRAAWVLQEQIGKIPIASADSYGFIVNRYFAPWLNEAVRVAEEGIADIATIDAASKEAFGVGMGPFELMNVTGIPIAMHVANTLANAFGPFYAPAGLLTRQVASGENWDLSGRPNKSKFSLIADRLLGAVLFVAAQLVDEKVGSVDDVELGARVGLRWPAGPFELANRIGTAKASELAGRVADSWSLSLPVTLSERAESGTLFEFVLVQSSIEDGIATLTLNRPDAMNAISEAVMGQLRKAFKAAAGNESVRGIVIAGRGKAFIAGADIRFFIENIEHDNLARTVEFTKQGQDFLREIEQCPKPVVARMQGLALGGGLELALACDRIVASEKAAMAFPETGIGIYPGLGGTQRTSRRIGVGLAKYLVFTGQMLSASEAAAIGLVDRVVAPEELDVAVREALAQGVVDERSPGPVPESYRVLAEFFEKATTEALLGGEPIRADDPAIGRAMERIARKAPIAIRIAGQLIEQGARLPLAEALPLELEHLREIFGTRDAYEGLRSIGRAAPAFEGR